jgi:hypothetical protein
MSLFISLSSTSKILGTLGLHVPRVPGLFYSKLLSVAFLKYEMSDQREIPFRCAAMIENDLPRLQADRHSRARIVEEAF